MRRDHWIAGLPADEVVPMAFRMAGDDGPIRALLAARGGFTRPGCGDAIGLATDEAPIPGAAPRRYLFSPRPWTPERWQHARETLATS
ncbi:MAG: hypothetical protein JNM82_04580 [Rhodocyclaceae bacterium]|nr:hypothetical protein [Rhodocyclaceae bacterium]